MRCDRAAPRLRSIRRAIRSSDSRHRISWSSTCQIRTRSSTTTSSAGAAPRRGEPSKSPMIVYVVIDDALSPDFPLGVELEVFIRRENADRFIAEVRGDDPELARHLRMEERQFEALGETRSPHLSSGCTSRSEVRCCVRVRAALRDRNNVVILEVLARATIDARSPLPLGQGTRRPCRRGRNSRSGSRRGTAGGSPRRSRTARLRRSPS